jgi:hypothetical protein
MIIHHTIDHHISWTTIFFMIIHHMLIIISHGLPYFSWSSITWLIIISHGLPYFSWSSITWLIIISHGPYFSWSSNRFFCSIDDYISWVTIFFTSKFGENSTIKKNHWRRGSLPENNRTLKKIPILFQHYWFNRLQINFLSLFISLFFHFCDVVTLVIIHKEI